MASAKITKEDVYQHSIVLQSKWGAGENIAGGYDSTDKVVAGWIHLGTGVIFYTEILSILALAIIMHQMAWTAISIIGCRYFKARGVLFSIAMLFVGIAIFLLLLNLCFI